MPGFVDKIGDFFFGLARRCRECVGKVLKPKFIDKFSNICSHGAIKSNREETKITAVDNLFINKAIVFTYPFFALYLCTQPWLSNWANNKWWHYSADYVVFNRNGSLEGSYIRNPGMCDTPAEQMHCTDGQNFTELAIKARGEPIGCGCGQGVLGEGLCPMTSYGYTLSDYVSTEPGIAAMLGLGFFPLLGTWRNTMFINRLAKPTKCMQMAHMWSLLAFQLSYLIWGMASDCIFPETHSIMTVAFLGAFMVHWILTALICVLFMGTINVDTEKVNIETMTTTYVAGFAVTVIALGAIPRVFITLNYTLGTTFFPNLNFFPLSYSFWFAEAVGLSATFGAYPIVIVLAFFFPKYSDFNDDGKISREEAELFALFKWQFQGEDRFVGKTPSTNAPPAKTSSWLASREPNEVIRTPLLN